MKYYDYNELKELILINKEYQEKFREQTDLERRNLKEDLIFHKRILSPLQVRLSINGLVLIDGHHRWELLSEVIKECPEFNLKIPVVVIKLDDIADVMLRTQLGRRNLSNGDIKQYVDRLITEDNLSANKAYKQVAEAIDKSISTVKRIHKPEQAEANRVSQKVRDITKKSSDERMGITDDISVKMNNFSPETTETSLKEKEEKLEESRQKRLSKKMGNSHNSQLNNSDYYKKFKGNLLDTKQLVEYEDKDYYDEVLANGSKYRTYTNKEDYVNSEEYISGAPVNPNNQHTSVPECERLILIKELIDSLKDHLPFFEDSPIHSDIHKLIENYTFRVNLLKK